jgi:hypothetical protein
MTPPYSGLKSKPSEKPNICSLYFLLHDAFSLGFYSSTPKMEICFSETSINFLLNKLRYIREDRSFHNHRCDKLKFYLTYTSLCINRHVVSGRRNGSEHTSNQTLYLCGFLATTRAARQREMRNKALFCTTEENVASLLIYPNSFSCSVSCRRGIHVFKGRLTTYILYQM